MTEVQRNTLEATPSSLKKNHTISLQPVSILDIEVRHYLLTSPKLISSELKKSQYKYKSMDLEESGASADQPKIPLQECVVYINNEVKVT